MKRVLYRAISMLSIIPLLAVTFFTPTPAQAANQQRQNSDELTWEWVDSAPINLISNLAVYDGFLFIAGTFQFPELDGRLFKFDGTEWIEINLSSETGHTVESIQALRVFDNKLFIGTRSVLTDGIKACVYSYNGSTIAIEYCAPGQADFSGIEEIIVHEDFLYAANGSRYSEVYRRDLSGNWIELGDSVNPYNPVRALSFYEGELYAGTGTHGNEAQIWKWNGTSWDFVINLAQYFNITQDGVLTIANFNDALYISLAGPGSPSPLIKYDGQDWMIHHEFSEASSANLTIIDDSLWLGTTTGAVYRLNEYDEWEFMGSTGASYTSSLVKYNEFIYAGTFYNDGLFRALLVDNNPPTVDSGGPYIVTEGGMITLEAVGIDPDNDPLIYSWDLDGDGTYEISGQSVLFSAETLDGPDTINISVIAEDNGGLSASDQTSVEVLNALPEIQSFEITSEPIKINTIIEVTADFSDPGIPDTHTAVWDWGDGTQSDGEITEDQGNGTVNGQYEYQQPGLYTINLTLIDDDGGEDTYTYQYLVVTNPNKDFVTGAGWFDSPTGAYPQNPDLSGKIIFNFTARYHKQSDAPTGIFLFKFHEANLDFRSIDYKWLIVSGDKAQMYGNGTLNDEPGYVFLISAVDGGTNRRWNRTDKLRIKIWSLATNEIVYDNKIGAADTDEPTTQLIGGTIIIH